MEELSEQEQQLLDLIGKHESFGRNYNVVVGSKKDHGLTSMTIEEVMKLQQRLKKKSGSAVGAFQFIDKVLAEEIKKQGISKDTLFTEEVQDSLMLGRLRSKRGFNDFMSGKLSLEAFAKNLSKEFASFPNPETGESYYKGTGNNKAGLSSEDFLTSLESIRDEQVDVSENFSINPDIITNHPELDDGTKEELLKMNDAVGFHQETIDKLQTQGFNSFLGESPLDQELNKNIVNDELSMQKKVKRTKPNDVQPSFSKNFKLLTPAGPDYEFEEGGLINKFNSNLDHENNAQGGIHISDNPEGGKNLVKGGETSFKDYIFSDDLKLDKKTAERFNLHSHFVGKTFADISERINAEIEDRPFDKIIVKTAEDQLNSIMLANEITRPPNSEFQGNDRVGFGGMFTGAAAGGAGGAGGGGMFDFLKNAGPAMGATGDSMVANSENNVIAGDAADNQTIGQVKDTVASMTGPWGQAMRGVQKMGQGIGNMVGGDTGAFIGDVFSPEESTIANFKDNDLKWEKKALGTIPGVGGIIAKKSADKKADEAEHRKIGGINAGIRQGSRFQHGGPHDTIGDDVIRAANAGTLNGTGNSLLPFNNVRTAESKPTSGSEVGNTTSLEGEFKDFSLGRYNKYFTPGETKNGVRTFNATAANPHNTQSGKALKRKIRQLNPGQNFNLDFTKPNRFRLPADIGTEVTDTGFAHGGQPHFGLDDGEGNLLPFDYNNKRPPTSGILKSHLEPEGIQGIPNLGDNDGGVGEFIKTRDRGIAIQARLDAEKTGVGKTISKADELLKKHGNDLLRTAPIFRNLLKKDEEAEYTSYNRLGDRFKKSRIDEANLQNRLDNASANTRRALLEASGGNTGLATTGLFQSHINDLKGASAAAFQQQGFDAGQNQMEQQFNLGVNQSNLQTDILEKDANAANRAATDDINRERKNAAWEDIGLLGKEGKLGDILKKTTGYNPSGDKVNSSPGFLEGLLKSSQQRSEEMEAKIAELEKLYKEGKNGK